MRVLHLLYDAPRNPWVGGGGALRVREVYRRFPRTVKTHVVSGGFPGAPPEEIIDGVHYHYLGSSPSAVASGVAYMAGVHRFLPAEDWDLVVEDFSPFTPCFARYRTSGPTLGQLHHLAGSHLIRQYRLAGVLPYLIERLIIRQFRGFIVPTQVLASRLHDGHARRIAIIPNGFDAELLQLSQHEEPFILFLGRLDSYAKGLDVLLAAFSRFHSDEPAVRLVLAGEGPDRRRLQRQVTNRGLAGVVHFLGRVGERAKRELLMRCLFLCLPSRFEGWGIAAMEAAACGKPTVGSNVPGLNEAVLHSSTGLLVPPEQPTSLANAFLRLARDAHYRAQLGQRARTRAALLTWDRIAAAQYAFYDSCVTKPEGDADAPPPQNAVLPGAQFEA